MNEKKLVGIDIGGTSIKLAFLTESGNINHKWEIATNKQEGGKHVISEIAASIFEKLEELHMERDQLIAAGVGAPGPVDTEKGLLFEAVNIGWPDDYPLSDLMETALNIPVAIDNDANCAALGEMWQGAGKGAKNMICITLGTGVGGGVINDGDIVHGSKGAAGEVGHITSVPHGGARCNCGKTGCLETVASATGIVRMAKEKMTDFEGDSKLKQQFAEQGTISAKDIFETASLGDSLAQETVHDLANYLGLALANVSVVLNPEKIVIGGGVSKAGDGLMTPLTTYFKKYAFKPVAENTEMVLAELGNDAGIVGAAWIAANKINYR
ncbi:ROK family glucokinase [Bacillus sp. FJAT-50079]|uniref:ROK family glucokinase n=1 Tax=Bacillus sp. FJAT-50079 TaxID=2833577 RepID=UPI001BC99F12|nr:ROK family glucokinase [Bacillus sp. FJAT-50079]MBS4209601.1 ROK family glucokinase [Bacillus sp. FJAT-50079]